MIILIRLCSGKSLTFATTGFTKPKTRQSKYLAPENQEN
jgi:hypothetical protein